MWKYRRGGVSRCAAREALPQCNLRLMFCFFHVVVFCSSFYFLCPLQPFATFRNHELALSPQALGCILGDQMVAVRAWLGFQEPRWRPLQAPQAPSGDPLEAQFGCQRPLRTLCSPPGVSLQPLGRRLVVPWPPIGEPKAPQRSPIGVPQRCREGAQSVMGAKRATSS